MKTKLSSGLAALVLVSATAASARDVTTPEAVTAALPGFTLSETDEAAVRDLVAKFADSWNKHDMAAMHELNTPDVEWVNAVGNDWIGFDNVRKGHTNFHHVLAAKNVMRVDAIALRSIAPDVAIVVTRLHFGGIAPDGKPGDVMTRGSWTMVRRGGVWKIAHFQNTVIDPKIQGPMDPLEFDETTGLPAATK